MSTYIDHSSPLSPGMPMGQIEAFSDPAPQVEEDETAGSAESSPRKIPSPATAADEFQEGPPLRRDPSRDQFDHEVDEAARLAREIVKVEDELGEKTKDAAKRLDPLMKALVLSGLHAWRLVHDRKISKQVVDEFALEAEIKLHGNATIPCSSFIRAIFARETEKGTDTYKRMQQRATTHAGAIDYALAVGMTDEEFQSELDAPRKAGTYHGIEELAQKGRAVRRAEKGKQTPYSPPPMPYRVTGDFTKVTPGTYLMLVDVVAETAEMLGALLDVRDTLLQRAIRNDEKARLKAA